MSLPPLEIVERYAQMLNTIEQCTIQGIQPPQEMVQECLHIETVANTTVMAHEVDTVMEKVNEFRAGQKEVFHADQQRRTQVAENALATKAFRATTRNLGISQGLGIGPGIHQQVQRGEEIEFTNFDKPRFDAKRMNELAKGYKFRNTTEAWDQLDQMVTKYKGGDKEGALAQAAKHGMNEENIKIHSERGLADAWQRRMADNAKDDPDTYKVTPDAQDQRKTQIHQAIADTHNDDMLEQQDVPEDWYEDNDPKSARSDLVAAFNQHDTIDYVSQVESEMANG